MVLSGAHFWRASVFASATLFMRVATIRLTEKTVETTRFILILALSFILIMLWQAWEEDYGKPPAEMIPEQTESMRDDVPITPQDITVTNPEITGVDEEAPSIIKHGKTISVKTDVLHLEIDETGATISLAELVKFPAELNGSEPVQLLYNNTKGVYLVQGGLLSQSEAPTHEDIFVAPKDQYELTGGNDVLNVSLTWESGSGIKVIKTYEFKRGEYLINVRYQVINEGSENWTGRAYGQIQRTSPKKSKVRTVYTFTGAALSTLDKPYEKIKFDDMREKKLKVDTTNGWIAMLQHYFVTAMVPANQEELYHYYTLALEDDRYAIGEITPTKTIAPGSTEKFEQKIYVGPKVQKVLEQIAPHLELTVDYGLLWFIAKPLFWCLQKFHSLTGNWGWAIILVTLMLKIIFYRLSAAGYLSMANMRKVQPRILAIRERYKNDRARLNQAMMDIYKQEKINPLGGCFPILIQIPVFIALYWVLLESVELRHAPFILWIHNLSGPDPYFVLPVLMGISMFVQQKLNPAPMDPVQEKIMMMLPLVFTVFFAFFPAGLVLYWVVNNILSIAQQWLITRKIENAASKSTQ